MLTNKTGAVLFLSRYISVLRPLFYCIIGKLRDFLRSVELSVFLVRNISFHAANMKMSSPKVLFHEANVFFFLKYLLLTLMTPFLRNRLRLTPPFSVKMACILESPSVDIFVTNTHKIYLEGNCLVGKSTDISP